MFASWNAACTTAWSREISSKSAGEESLVNVEGSLSKVMQPVGEEKDLPLVVDGKDVVPLWREEVDRRREEAEKVEAAAAAARAPEAAGYPAASSTPQAPAPESKAEESKTPNGEKQEKSEIETKKPASKAAVKKKAKAKASPRLSQEEKKEEKKEESAPSNPHLRPELDVSALSASQKAQECKYFAESTSASGSLLYHMIDGQLTPVAHFVTDPSFEKFAKACYEHKFIEGRGTIGRTYHAKVPEFLQDARKASPVLMIRKKIAMAHNLKSFYCAAFGNGIIEVFHASMLSAAPVFVDRLGA